MTPLEAWTAVVSGEDAAVYAYSVAGARVAQADRRRAVTGLELHRQRRSRAASLISQLGGTVPAGAPAYDLMASPRRTKEAQALLAHADLALVALYASAAGAATDEDRRWAVRSAAACAAAAVEWGSFPQAFPTADDPSIR